jgi:hypothetical protein
MLAMNILVNGTYDSMAKTMQACAIVVSINAHVQNVFGLTRLDVIQRYLHTFPHTYTSSSVATQQPQLPVLSPHGGDIPQRIAGTLDLSPGGTFAIRVCKPRWRYARLLSGASSRIG